jgi:predicted transcriptional regulator
MKTKNSVNSRKLILDTLKKHPEGLTLTNIAKICGMHRHTATKYIYELRGADLIYERDIGPAKLCYIKEDLTKKEENKTMKRLDNGKKSKLGQVQILAIILFLFMVPTGIIIAQNATESIQNLSLNLEGNLIANSDNITDFVFENTSENSTDILQNFNANETTNETSNENISEIITPNEPAVFNESNETQTETPITNETLNETNETNQTIIIPEISPKLEIKIKYPENIVRGESFVLEAKVFNPDSIVAKNVVLEWHLPEGFNIVSGNYTEDCGDLFEQSICFSNITVSTSFSASIGPNDIKVEVRHR